MNAVDRVAVVQIAFAVSIVVVALVLAGAWFYRLTQQVIQRVALAVALAAIAAWVLFALDPSAELAVAAGGLTVSLLATIAALGVHRGVVHSHRLDSERSKAEARLDE